MMTLSTSHDLAVIPIYSKNNLPTLALFLFYSIKHTPMEVICLEERAFYALLDKVMDYVEEKRPAEQDKWIPDSEAMRLLKVKSPTTLQKYRDEGLIRFSQPSKKVILYDRDSIMDYLEQHAKDTF